MIISDEYSVNDLLRISDLNILPWISTTFFEALYFEADVFVLDEDLFDEPFIMNLILMLCEVLEGPNLEL